MLRKLFKKKRKIKLHELAMEYSFLQYRKNLFLRRYITLMVAGILFMFWINGKFSHEHHWTYYFALNNDNQIVQLNSPSVPQPFSRDDITDYAKEVAYELFSITPETQRSHLNTLFSNYVLQKGFIKETYTALEKSGITQRLKNGWYYSLESLGEPKINMGQLKIGGNSVNAWQVVFPDFVLYGRKGQKSSKIKGDLSVWVAKMPFMTAPSRLSVVKLFVSNMKDIGNKYGY